ncbi:host attachment family protein [Luteimonas sp. FCS-9]|uniref:host attachment family protein n=1 Tax=Luteimonas sp. FCS-9 TaxID=1547516 RepID=UPI00063E7D72|nr:host attachment family protein [Luteimonas sp. FCS-9]KLJ02431.1 attachment protein [Luteimonas sp. FCS-9]
MAMKIPQGALVVVANGGAARVFTNVGENGALTLRQEALLEGMNLDDDGPAGAMPAESSASQLDEATFAKQLALGLNDGALKNKFAHLVLIADPQTLGRVRPLLHKETSQRLVADLAKDYTNAPLDAIERALS